MVDMSSGTVGPLPVQRALETVGALALVALVALTPRSGEPVLLAAAVLPTLFLAAGALGGPARPDHRGLQALTAVGACHLTAFALSGLVLGADGTGRTGGAAWALTLLSQAAFLAGFAALALVLGCYPDGRFRTRAQRLLLVGVGLACATSLVVEALLSTDAELVVGEGSVAAPGPLPLLATDLVGLPLVLLAVVAAVPVLVVSASSLPLESRRALGWAKLAGLTVGLMLLVTPVAEAALPGHLWDGAFIAAVGVAPFLLLAGLVRYRLLAVDLYVVRSAARGVVVVGVLAVYAALSLWSARGPGVGAALTVTVLAALTGQSVVRRLEHVADRWFNGGRVAQGTLARELDRAVASLDIDTDLLPERLCSLVAEGLDVSWVRLRDGDLVLAGPVEGPPAEVIVELDTGGHRVGVLECGPRRGGWRRTHRAALGRAAGPVALALRQRRLTQELAARVAELAASRGRLIQAEESARRRVERDLHDGVQQQLVALLATLSVAQAHLSRGGPGGVALRTGARPGAAGPGGPEGAGGRHPPTAAGGPGPRRGGQRPGRAAAAPGRHRRRPAGRGRALPARGGGRGVLPGLGGPDQRDEALGVAAGAGARGAHGVRWSPGRGQRHRQRHRVVRRERPARAAGPRGGAGRAVRAAGRGRRGHHRRRRVRRARRGGVECLRARCA